jgi:hypothetical protein
MIATGQSFVVRQVTKEETAELLPQDAVNLKLMPLGRRRLGAAP